MTWQYVVIRWNDRDDQLGRAITLAEEAGIPIHFDFAQPQTLYCAPGRAPAGRMVNPSAQPAPPGN